MGTLYLVATPIGNLEDLSPRAQRILSDVNLIAAEDTRHSRKLLSHFDIHTRMISYYEHNKLARQDEILQALETADVALISDAGMPGVSDPGETLVDAAWAAGHRVSPIPGPSALVAALAASGLPSDHFEFVGFLPRQPAKRRQVLEDIGRRRWTTVAFETPHRIESALEDMQAALGPERLIAVCRELTKLHEQIERGPVAEVRAAVTSGTIAGEYTLVIAGTVEAHVWDEAMVRSAVAERLASGDKPSAAAAKVAQLSGWKRADVYQMTLEDA